MWKGDPFWNRVEKYQALGRHEKSAREANLCSCFFFPKMKNIAKT